MQTRLLRDLLCVLLTAGALGCGAQPGSTEAEPEPLLLYSGRNESLIGPILERFTEDTGVEVAIRYGGTAELSPGSTSSRSTCASPRHSLAGSSASDGFSPRNGSSLARKPEMPVRNVTIGNP